jgi:hypothetical protein
MHSTFSSTLLIQPHPQPQVGGEAFNPYIEPVLGAVPNGPPKLKSWDASMVGNRVVNKWFIRYVIQGVEQLEWVDTLPPQLVDEGDAYLSKNASWVRTRREQVRQLPSRPKVPTQSLPTPFEKGARVIYKDPCTGAVHHATVTRANKASCWLELTALKLSIKQVKWVCVMDAAPPGAPTPTPGAPTPIAPQDPKAPHRAQRNRDNRGSESDSNTGSESSSGSDGSSSSGESDDDTEPLSKRPRRAGESHDDEAPITGEPRNAQSLTPLSVPQTFWPEEIGAPWDGWIRDLPPHANGKKVWINVRDYSTHPYQPKGKLIDVELDLGIAMQWAADFQRLRGGSEWAAYDQCRLQQQIAAVPAVTDDQATAAHQDAAAYEHCRQMAAEAAQQLCPDARDKRHGAPPFSPVRWPT